MRELKQWLKFEKTRLLGLRGLSLQIFAQTPYGPVLVVRSSDATNRFALTGAYGQVVFDAVKRLRPGDVFIDIGANSGLWSMMAARFVTPQGGVFAFEPQPDLAIDFMLNRRANNAGGVFFNQAAVGPSPGMVSFSAPNPKHSGIAHISQVGSWQSPMISGEQVMAMAQPALSEYSSIMIKIDIEGYEYQALRSVVQAQNFSRVSCVIVECDSTYLKRFGDAVGDLYMLLGKQGMYPTIKLEPDPDGHYDEVFVRKQ